MSDRSFSKNMTRRGAFEWAKREGREWGEWTRFPITVNPTQAKLRVFSFDLNIGSFSLFFFNLSVVISGRTAQQEEEEEDEAIVVDVEASL